MRRAPWCVLLVVAALPWTTSSGAAQQLVASPSDPKSFTWTHEGVLAVGGGGLTKDQVDWLYDQGFRAIASFRAEHQDPADYIRGKGMAFLYLPVDHAVNMNVSQLRTFVAWAKEQEAAGRPMYIHCTNGWHRAAAFAVAWEMEREKGTFDAVADEAEDRRPGTVMRAPAALLDYEGLLTGKPGLTVLLQSPLSRPEKNGTMPVTVQVLAKGQPVAGASVRVWSEESRLGFSGKTDAQGRYSFTYAGNVGKSPVDHLYARASAPGYLDGADNVELFYVNPVRPGALEVDAAWTPGGIHVDVRKHGVHAVSHVIATGPNGWSFIERTSGGEVLVPLPPGGGPVTIRAERWGADPGQLVVSAPGSSAPPTSAPPREEPAPPKTEPKPAPPKAQPTPQVDPAQHGGALRAKDAPPERNTAPLPASLLEPLPGAPAGTAPRADGSAKGEATRTWLAVATGALLLGAAAWVVMGRRRPTA